VNTEAVLDLIAAGRIPVVSTIAPDADGRGHNINADTAAARAGRGAGRREAADADRRRGPVHELADRDSLVSEIDAGADATAADAGGGHGAQDRGLPARRRRRVPSAHVIDGRVEHCVLVELFTDEGTGTKVVRA
jgi:acetylglutamate kinase